MANVGAAQVNCKPARVFRIGRGPTNSGQGLLSADNAVSRDTSTLIRNVRVLEWTMVGFTSFDCLKMFIYFGVIIPNLLPTYLFIYLNTMSFLCNTLMNLIHLFFQMFNISLRKKVKRAGNYTMSGSNSMSAVCKHPEEKD